MAKNLTKYSNGSSAFIFEQIKTPDGKKSIDQHTNTYLVANTTPFSNDHLPFPMDFKFEPCFVRTPFKELANEIRHFNVRNDDIWIISFPKTGSTWMENIVWQLKNGIDTTKPPFVLFDGLYLEMDMILNDEESNKMHKTERLEMVKDASSPRIIKTHLPPHLLPIELWTNKPKIIYIARNPKDTAISMFHMINGFKKFNGTIDEYFDCFLEDRTNYAPFDAHILTYWKLCHLDYFLFLTYEQLVADRFNGIKIISNFLRCTYTENELKQLADYASIDSMQKLHTKKFHEFR